MGGNREGYKEGNGSRCDLIVKVLRGMTPESRDEEVVVLLRRGRWRDGEKWTN